MTNSSERTPCPATSTTTRKGGDWIPGDPRNLKITYPDDLFEAEKVLHETNFHLE